MVVKEHGWNVRLQKPFDNFYDVFAVTARSAFNYRFNQSSRCAYMDEDEDLKIDTDWSDIFINLIQIVMKDCKETFFAVRNTSVVSSDVRS